MSNYLLETLKDYIIGGKDMDTTKKYPLLEINLNKISDNTKYLLDLCNENNISISARTCKVIWNRNKFKLLWINKTISEEFKLFM